jgi:hypothetical protein
MATNSNMRSGKDMKRRQKDTKAIPVLKDREAYQLELGLEQERIYRKRTLDALEESEEREVIEKAGQGNRFKTKKG